MNDSEALQLMKRWAREERAIKAEYNAIGRALDEHNKAHAPRGYDSGDHVRVTLGTIWDLHIGVRVTPDGFVIGHAEDSHATIAGAVEAIAEDVSDRLTGNRRIVEAGKRVLAALREPV